MARRYIKRLGIYIVNGDEEERKKENRGCLFCILFFVLAFAGALVLAHFTDSCRKNPQVCYCDSLAQEPDAAKRNELMQEIKKRGYSCVGIYYQD